MSDRHQDDFNSVPDTSESAEHIEKLNREIDGNARKNKFFEGEEGEGKSPIATYIESIKMLFKSMMPSSGKGSGDGEDDHDGEEEADKRARQPAVIGAIIAVAVLVGFFALKSMATRGGAPQQQAVSEAPDKSASSLFGDEFVPEVGKLKGELMEQKELQKKLEEMEKRFEQKLAAIREENEKLKEENQKLREAKKTVAEADASAPDALGDLPELPGTPASSPSKDLNRPTVPGGVDPIASQLPSTLRQDQNNNYKYPANTPAGFAERYPVSNANGTLQIDAAEEKINVYSPVKDAVKGGAEAVSKAATNAATPVADKGEPVAVIPATTIGRAVLLNGVDAPTGTSASKDPIPVVLQFLTDGHTASYFDNVPIKGCRLIASGYGDLASERAYFRTERIVCAAEDGRVFSATADGYLLGEDGKAGLRGRLVSKQGSMIAKSFIAGLLQGFGDVVRTSSQNTTISTLTGATTFTPLTGKDLARAGIGGGIGEAASRIADFYMKMAESVMPILEVDASRKVEVVFSHDLKFFPLKQLHGENGEGYWDIPYTGGK